MAARRANLPSVSLASVYEDLKADYAAAKVGRFRRRRTGISAMGSGADYHYRSDADYLRMLEYARDMDRNDAIVGQMVDRAVINIIGETGPTLDPQTGDDKLDLDLWQRFDEWANDPDQCDKAGEMTFADMAEMVLRSTFVDGDIFALLVDDGSIELIEAHRCRTPSNTKRNVIHGVLLDDFRRRISYWFTRDDVDPNTPVSKVGDMRVYPARDQDGSRVVLHIYNPKRVTQTRGVTHLAPVFDLAGMFEDLNFAKLVQAQIVSCIAILRERSEAYTGGGAGQYGDRQIDQLPGGLTRVLENIAPGMEVAGAVGETLKGWSPNVPNPEFFDHAKLILTLIGINLGVPLVMMLMDASETNFSGWRGAIDQARQHFKRNQRWINTKFFCRVYQAKVRQWMAEDPALHNAAERLGPRIFTHRWNFPRWPYVQPLQDAQADALRLERRLTSPRRLRAERGLDNDEIREETIADNKADILAALKARREILEQYPEAQIDWRELLWLPAGAAPLNLQATASSSSNGRGQHNPSPERDDADADDN